ncbi:GNAT family N-acetyltransferase [Flagellimonas meishanensis]|uniref:GNAT family N-acetyltransferase n=1 Tax=Flagellimonas meishanensis TaxID=2873264 RepID=UPI001CA784CD|nr:GNAT family N-acetyltransferase [[Muricauda] meishanensis]
MKNKVVLELVQKDTVGTYIEVGQQSYCEHYLHLWENEDSSPYLQSSFIHDVVHKELEDSNVILFLVKTENIPVGIVKLILDQELDEISAKDALLAQKIYLLKSFSGLGIGKKVLQLIEGFAKNLQKKVVWLDTMQKGKPIHFYLKNGYKIKKESELKLPGAKAAERPMWILTKQL